MKNSTKLRRLLAILLLAMCLGATSAHAVATVTPGSFTASGSGTAINPDTSTTTIDCTAVSLSASDADGDGTGVFTITFDSCSAAGQACTITPMSLVYGIDGTGGIGTTVDTWTDDTSATVSAFVDCQLIPDCRITFTTATLTNTVLHGTIADSGGQPLTITGNVGTDGTALCTGQLSIVTLIDDDIEITV